MLIILEGPDGAGKSTLARNLSAMLGADIVHFGKDSETFSLATEYISIILSSQHRNLIIDRLWISEIIYSKIMRGGNCRLSEKEIKVISYAFHEMDGRLVYCLPDYHTCLGNYTKNIENEYIDNQTKFTRVYLEYFKATLQKDKYLPGRFTRLNNIHSFNYEEESCNNLLERLEVCDHL